MLIHCSLNEFNLSTDTPATEAYCNDDDDALEASLGKKKAITTKHDHDICCRKNTKSMETKVS